MANSIFLLSFFTVIALAVGYYIYLNDLDWRWLWPVGILWLVAVVTTFLLPRMPKIPLPIIWRVDPTQTVSPTNAPTLPPTEVPPTTPPPTTPPPTTPPPTTPPPTTPPPTTPPPIPTSALNLTRPEPNTCYNDSNIHFEWNWNRDLKNEGEYGGEFFAIRVWPVGTGHHSLDWLKDNRYTLDATQGKDGLVPLEAGAVYEWNVAVVDPYGDPVSEKFYIIDESPPAQFSYCPSDGPTPTDEIIPP